MNSDNNIITVKVNRPSSFPKLCLIVLMILSALLIGSSLVFGKDTPVNTILAYAIMAVPLIAGIPTAIALFKRAK